MEIWENIIGYEGLYQVSNYGNVKSFYGNGRILKPQLSGKPGNQYYRVNLCKDGVRKQHRINVLVGIHHIPNPDNLPVVHHKDNNKLNNHVDNLEWSTYSYNTIHAYESGLGNIKKVIQLDLNGNFVNEYESMAEAGRQCNLHYKNISSVCRGKRKTTGGFLWKYN